MLKPKPARGTRAAHVAHAAASEALALALRDAADRGQGVPCIPPPGGGGGVGVSPGAWTSEDPEALADAAAACHGCPVLELCREAGHWETAGVWGGVNRGQSRAKRRPLRALALLSLATSPRPLTVDAVAAEIAPLLPEAVSRERVADALSKAARLGLALRVAPSTFTATATGEAVAGDLLDAEADDRPRRGFA